MAAIDHLPGLRRTAGNGFKQGIGIKAGRRREIQPFRQTLYQPGNTDLVDHLCLLPLASRPHTHDARTITFHHRQA